MPSPEPCDFSSTRVRQAYIKAAQNGDASGFLALAKTRDKIRGSLILARGKRDLAFKSASRNGVLSSVYDANNSMQTAAGFGTSYLHGNSTMGEDNTSSGAQSAMYFNAM